MGTDMRKVNTSSEDDFSLDVPSIQFITEMKQVIHLMRRILELSLEHRIDMRKVNTSLMTMQWTISIIRSTTLKQVVHRRVVELSFEHRTDMRKVDTSSEQHNVYYLLWKTFS